MGFDRILLLLALIDAWNCWQGEGLTLFYNPAATKMAPNDVFGVAFSGGFNQPIMCGGEPRQMTLQVRGKADPPIYTIRIRVPQHGEPPGQSISRRCLLVCCLLLILFAAPAPACVQP